MKFKNLLLGLWTALIVIGLDQLSKAWVLELFHNGITGAVEQRMPRPHTVTSFFDLVLVWNHGVSFGMFNHDTTVPWVLIGLAAVLVALVGFWLVKSKTWGEALALGLIIGGAVGNVIDRARLGAVVDFLDFHWAQYHWPAFNVADSSIVVGACLILYLWAAQAKTSG